MASKGNMLVNIFKVPDLRSRVLFTLFCLVIYRIGSHITVPGVDTYGLTKLVESFRDKAIGSLFAYFDLFAGGAFERFTIFALNIMPYISASIIIQIMTVVVPKLEMLAKEGESGRKEIQKYTRYLTIAICIVQSFFLSRWIASSGFGVVSEAIRGNSFLFSLLVVCSITTGTVFLMWLGEQITERGIGNGISLIIFAGIAARIPQAFLTVLEKVREGEIPIIVLVAVLVIFFVVVFFVVYEQMGQRRVPVNFSKKVVGRKVYGGHSNYIPFKVNPTGVMPIIFASAILLAPSFISSSIGTNYPTLIAFFSYFTPGKIPYMLMYSFFIIIFAIVYTRIQFNPIEIADNLKKSGGYVPGIRPGSATVEYLQRILNRISTLGAFFLALVAIFPDILMNFNLFSNLPREFLYLMGGTSLLILVAIDLDTMKQIESQLVMREYDGFLMKTKSKRRRM